MKIQSEISGVREVNIRIFGMTDRIREELSIEMQHITADLVQYITQGKLSGQVLNSISGRLRGSIGANVVTTEKAVVGTVYSSGVPYARIQEEGGRTSPHMIFPKNARYLHFFGKRDGDELFLRSVNHPGSRMPARSFLKSGLMDRRDQILNDLYDAVVRGLNK